MNWKNAKTELPTEICHHETLWCSDEVLTRKAWKDPEGNVHYHYAICRYLFDRKDWIITENQSKFYEPDEWCELETEQRQKYIITLSGNGYTSIHRWLTEQEANLVQSVANELNAANTNVGTEELYIYPD